MLNGLLLSNAPQVHLYLKKENPSFEDNNVKMFAG